VPTYPPNLDLDFSTTAFISWVEIFNADELTSVIPMASFNFESLNYPLILFDIGYEILELAPSLEVWIDLTISFFCTNFDLSVYSDVSNGEKSSICSWMIPVLSLRRLFLSIFV
jgi:hypothetical protein